MTRPDHPNRRPTRRSTASTHPNPTRSGERRPVERRPWPTAPTTTRVSPGKPTGARSSTAPTEPIPATVWTTGPDPIDLDAAWPASLLEQVVTSFSRPGAQVVLLTSPTPDDPDRRLVAGRSERVVNPTPTTEPNLEPADAAHTVERLGRTVRVHRIPTGPAPAPRPRHTTPEDLRDPTRAALPATPTTTAETLATTTPEDTCGDTDLVITNLRPPHGDHHAADLVALFAARALRVGGIFVVLTHCDWSTGELTDPTGAVVTAGQNADLLYLQHIVVVHAPLRDGRFQLTDTRPDEDATGDAGHHDGGEAHPHPLVRELPTPHRRIHSDVLVFAQPHDHRSPSRDTAAHCADHR